MFQNISKAHFPGRAPKMINHRLYFMYLNYETLYFMGILPKEVIPQGVLGLQIPVGLRLPSFHPFPPPQIQI